MEKQLQGLEEIIDEVHNYDFEGLTEPAVYDMLERIVNRTGAMIPLINELRAEAKLKNLACDSLPDVTARLKSGGNEGEARATLPPRSSAKADDLLPCPFCGKTDGLELDNLGDADSWNIECGYCNLGQHSIHTRESAIIFWNKRAR